MVPHTVIQYVQYQILSAFCCALLTLFWLCYLFIVNSHDEFTHIPQGYFTGTGAIIWLPSASDVTLKDMGKLGLYLATTKEDDVKLSD